MNAADRARRDRASRAKPPRYTPDELLECLIADLESDLAFGERQGNDPAYQRRLRDELAAAKARRGRDPREVMRFHHNFAFGRVHDAPVTDYDVQIGG